MFPVEKPSEMIRFALVALNESEKFGSAVKPDMNTFHHMNESGVCFACLGGLYAIKRFNLNPKSYSKIEIRTSSGKTNDFVFGHEDILDSLRLGRVEEALSLAEIQFADAYKLDRVISDYAKDPDGFKSDMNLLARQLELLGY